MYDRPLRSAIPVTLLAFLIVFAANVRAQETAPTPTPDPKPTPTPVFTDVAAESGLDFLHYNGMTGKLYLPEIMGSGAALFDYDRDGDLDVFLVQGRVLEPDVKPSQTIFPWTAPEPPVGRLFRNDLTLRPDGTRSLKFTDVTKESRINADGYGFGVVTGDVNNDGLVDLYVTNLGPNKLFLNKGDGTFEDATAKSGTDDPRWSIGGSLFDYDRDGFLDLFVVNYANFDLSDQPKCYSPTSAKDYCGPKAFRQVGNSLFRNRGDGTFENVTEKSGLNEDFGHGLGSIAADLNDDGWPDLYVANDGDPNQLWINLGNGRFENEGYLSGAAVNREGKAEASMGVDAGDFNQDGTEDLFITHILEETHTLYKNTGGAVFEDITSQSRIGLPDLRLTGFGTLFFDYDNDCLLDLFIANGAVKMIRIIHRPGNRTVVEERYPLGELNQLFRNTGGEVFEDVSERAGDAFRRFEVSRGAAFGDIDNDGDTDILVTNNNGRAELLRNNVGSAKNWLGLRLVGPDGKRDALGAKVEVFLDEKTVLRRRARTDGSYASAHDPRVLVGLGPHEKVLKVRVTWPDGRVEEFKDLPAGSYLTLPSGPARPRTSIEPKENPK